MVYRIYLKYDYYAMEQMKKKRIEHIVTCSFLAAGVAFSVFYFGLPILQRLWMSICDLGRSLAAYIILLFTWKDGVVEPTVQLFPEEMETILPLTWEELRIFFDEWWEIFSDGKTLLAFLLMVLEKLSLILSWISLAILPLAAWIFILWIVNRGIDNDHAKNTTAQEKFERYRRKVLIKIKTTISGYRRFVFSRWYYWLAFALIWAYNLNFLSIAVEAVAWIFYVGWAGTFDAWINILVQIAKLVVDFSVAARFIPSLIWAIIIYMALYYLRLHMGRKALKKCIEHDNEFIDKYPGALFVHGKQRSKKTSMLAMLKILYERRFRDKADEKMLTRDKQFPFFPWINLEKWIDKARAEHKIFMLYHCRRAVRALRKAQEQPLERRQYYLRLIRKKYAYPYNDFYFGYDTEYGLIYDDGLVEIHLYDALEMYAQLYFIYHQSTPLDLSNLAIREDFTWKDKGNFPLFDGNLLKKTTQESANASTYSHVIDFDAFRPGLKFDPDNPNRDAVEHGIGVVQEVDKERKNSKTRSAAGNKAAGELGIATQDNDGFEIDLKVRGQVALVDYVDFWVWLIDAQRVGDLGASAAELTNQIFIKGRADEYLKIPFFEIEDLIFHGLSWIYDKIHKWFRFRKGSNTLPHHLLKLSFAPLFRWYDRLEKEFTAWKVNVRVTDGGDGQELGMDHFWILNTVTYRNRFASDVCKAFYEYRFARSKKGIDDIECYEDTATDVNKMCKQNSYFSEDMTVFNGIDSRRKRAEQRGKRKDK